MIVKNLKLFETKERENMRELIKVHTDVMTVASEICKMQAEYESQGYECESLLNCLKIKFNDGFAMIFWSNGAFYQEFYKYNTNGEAIAI